MAGFFFGHCAFFLQVSIVFGMILELFCNINNLGIHHIE